jgi:hypothetical protein
MDAEPAAHRKEILEDRVSDEVRREALNRQTPRFCLINRISGIMEVGGFRKEAHHATPL